MTVPPYPDSQARERHAPPRSTTGEADVATDAGEPQPPRDAAGRAAVSAWLRQQVAYVEDGPTWQRLRILSFVLAVCSLGALPQPHGVLVCVLGLVASALALAGAELTRRHQAP